MFALRCWSCVAALIFLASFVAHLSTFVGIDPMSGVPGVMFLHFAIFPPFIAAIFIAKRNGFELKHVPPLLSLITRLAIFYAFINVALLLIHTASGSPTQRGNEYFLEVNAHPPTPISAADFHLHQAYVVRGFSGHWMLFSLASLVFFQSESNRRRLTFVPIS